MGKRHFGNVAKVTGLRFGSLVNIAILAGIVLAMGYFGASGSNQQPVQPALFSKERATAPIDSVSSTDIAVHLARMSNLDTAPAVVAQAEIQKDQMTLPASDNNLAVEKPQIVETDLKSRLDIETYVVQEGDTLASIAKKFGVTSNSIRWSNDLGSRSLVAVGRELAIPPVEGIVYTVKRGDTPDALASKYGANKDRLIAFNDAEIDGLTIGEKIVIPGGAVAAPAPSRVPFRPTFGSSGGYSSGRCYGYVGYGFCQCTAYAAARRAELGRTIPSNWGNARDWASRARASGYTVNNSPAIGAVIQNGSGGLGYQHVAVVNAILSDGSVRVSEQNYPRGRGARHDRVIPASRVHSYNYIH